MEIEKFNTYNNSLIKLFIKLTEFTIPSGKEKLVYSKVIESCDKKLNQDKYGNLFIKIGNSKRLFTAHLDTFCRKVEKINHVIEDGFIKTDGTTILGGDNKVGCCILINMINANIPGTYYFFVKEEIGRLGSEYLNETISDNDYVFCVAFDRKEIGNIVTHQRGIKLCNDKLADFLVKEFSKNYKFKKDPNGVSCDSFSFNEKVNNCLNISTGVYDEHRTSERLDINFFKSLNEICLGLDWDYVEELSNTKQRGKLTVSELGVSDPYIAEVLEYFMDNGYVPSRAVTYNEEFGIYSPKLYFKVKPKIFDHFDLQINSDRTITMLDNPDIIGQKEDIISFIQEYNSVLVEFKLTDSYHILGIENGYFVLLINNNKKILLKEELFEKEGISDYEKVVTHIKLLISRKELLRKIVKLN